MKHIHRWGLMRNTQAENDLEHTCTVSMIAHALVVTSNIRYNTSIDIGKTLEYALYHEAAEVITGDLATPIKYYNAEINSAFKHIEKLASKQLVAMIPEDIRNEYEKLLIPDEESIEWKFVKAADKIAAYIKCLEELKVGNSEFLMAKKSIYDDIISITIPAVKDYFEECIPSFQLSLDELK